MKKIRNVLMTLILLFGFSTNILSVKAEDETKPTNDENPTGEVSQNTDENENEEPEKPTDVKVELTNIKINDNKIVCSNDSNPVCKFNITNNDTKSIKVTYDVSKGATATPSSGIEKEIKEGTTKFSVEVTASDKKVIYNFEITKKIVSTDSTLKSLKVNGQSIELKNDTLKYQTNVSFTTKKLEITAIANDEKAKVIDFNEGSASFDFFDTKKEIKIKVQAEDGSISTYVLTVNKRSEADTTLKSLTIKNYTIDFSSEVTDYEIKVLKNVSKLEIEAKANDNNASVKITNPTLQIGENIVKIEVSNDGNTNTYQIKVTKLDEDDKTLGNLKSLSIEGYEIDFSPDEYEYDVYIQDENYLKIDAKAKMEESVVDITGNLDLVDGSVIKIKVTYDEDIYNVYKINIIKDGTVMPSTIKISKKAAALVISFDIISMAIMGVVKFREKIKKNKTNNNITNTKVRNVKSINLDDDVDVI